VKRAISKEFPAISAQTTEIQRLPDPEFRKAWDTYVADMKAQDPKFAETKYERVNAFVDRRTFPPRIWIHRDREKADTLIHEVIHTHAHPEWQRQVGSGPVDEAVTEYFSRKIAEAHDFKLSHSYDEGYLTSVATADPAIPRPAGASTASIPTTGRSRPENAGSS
jgi:hypothetical protein